MRKYIFAILLLVAGGINAFSFYQSQRWVYFAVVGICVPIAALVEWHLARARSPDSARTADRLLVYVTLALGAGSL